MGSVGQYGARRIGLAQNDAMGCRVALVRPNDPPVELLELAIPLHRPSGDM